MKRNKLHALKNTAYRLAMAAVLLFGALTISAMAQGALGLWAGIGLLLLQLLALNTVCGLLLPASPPTAAQMRAAAQALPGQPVLRVVQGGGGRVA